MNDEEQEDRQEDKTTEKIKSRIVSLKFFIPELKFLRILTAA
jgi:hypothetical protein